MSSAFNWAKQIVESSTGIKGIDVPTPPPPPPPPPPQRPMSTSLQPKVDNQDARDMHQQYASSSYNYNIYNQNNGGYNNISASNYNSYYQNPVVYGPYGPQLHEQPNYYNIPAVQSNYSGNAMLYNVNNYASQQAAHVQQLQSQAIMYPQNDKYNSQQLNNINYAYQQQLQVSSNSSSSNTKNISKIPKVTNVLINNNISYHNTSNESGSAPIQTNGTNNEIVWPDSLKEFVANVFKPCENDHDRTFVSNELRKLITRVTSEGRLHVHRWDLEQIQLLPVPSPTISVSTTISNKKRNNDYDHYRPPVSNLSPKNSKINNKKFKKSFDVEDDINDSSGYYGPNISDVTLNKAKIIQPIAIDSSHLQKRKNRFEKVNKSPKLVFDNSLDSDFHNDTLIVIGTCRELEKDYFRLTSEPDPSTVRPENVLIKAVTELKKKWKEKSVDYKYMCSQLKAVRQDFTVQKISNSFTVDAYEFHARVALEMEDLNEYNQCQTQLTPLYESGLNGAKAEFFAYLILYYVYAQGNKRFHTGNRDLTILLANLSHDIKEDRAIKHALAVRKAITFDNYHNFFKLYKDTPNMGRHIINQMVEFRRIQALMTICRSYIPSVPVSFVSNELSFSCVEDAKEYFKKIGCIIMGEENDVNNLELNTKDTDIDFEKAIGEDKPDLRFII